MGFGGERGRVQASLASLALVLCLVGTVGCAAATAGQPGTGSAGSGTAGQGSGTGTQTGHDCAGAAEHAGPVRPDADAAPLVSIGGSSGWQPPWSPRAMLTLYPDGTVALIPDDGPTPSGASAAAWTLQPAVGGWIDDCTADHLTAQLDDLIDADYGTPQVFDAGSTTLRIDRGAGRKPADVSVYALNVPDATGLTADQQHARQVVADWINDLRDAITVTGPLPDRVRITPTGPDPWDNTIMSSSAPEQHPVAWQGDTVPTSCTVATGDDARAALASMRAALGARTSPGGGQPTAWGAFTVPDGSRTTYLAEQQVLPGDGCR